MYEYNKMIMRRLQSSPKKSGLQGIGNGDAAEIPVSKYIIVKILVKSKIIQLKTGCLSFQCFRNIKMFDSSTLWSFLFQYNPKI